VPGGLFILMITSTKGSPNIIIHPTRARNTGFGKENFGRVMMSVGLILLSPEGRLRPLHLRQ
jgi:hypothetical protein